MGPGQKVAKRFKAESTPTFAGAHQLLYGKPSTDNVYKEWKVRPRLVLLLLGGSGPQNCAKKGPNRAYTHTNINQTFADWIVREVRPAWQGEGLIWDLTLQVKPAFMVEVGSFTGLSSGMHYPPFSIRTLLFGCLKSQINNTDIFPSNFFT